MKKITYLTTFLILLITFSCNKDDDSSEDTPPATGTLSVDVDGQSLKVDKLAAVITGSNINISGTKNDDESIVLTVVGTTIGEYQLGFAPGAGKGVGAYTVQSNPSNGSWVSQADGTSSQGKIIITEINEANKTITGTFSFIGTNDTVGSIKEFTNGVFNAIPYTTNVGNPTNDNSFSVKVDGVEFEKDLISTSGAFGNIGISAINTNAGNTRVALLLPGDVTSGTYDFEFFGSPSAQYATSTEIFKGDGQYTITSHDVANKRIIGTFSFTAEDLTGVSSETFEITEGAFDVTY